MTWNFLQNQGTVGKNKKKIIFKKIYFLFTPKFEEFKTLQNC